MKKSANVDIRNLFRKFGGDTGSYQEIHQDDAVEKSQQSWPIVRAMEKNRAGAPMLRASAAVVPDTHVSSPVLSVAGAPVAAKNNEVAGARPASLAAMFAKPAPTVAPLVAPSAAPAASLFGALNAAVKPVAVNSRPVSHQPVQASRSRKNDPLDSVFSRLLNRQEPAAANLPENSLRSMLGFLKK